MSRLRYGVENEIAAVANLLGLDADEIGDVLLSLGARPFVARQVFRWIYGRRLEGFDGMTDLPLGMRKQLASAHELRHPTVTERIEAPDGTTRFVFRLDDGARIESVWIPSPAPESR